MYIKGTLKESEKNKLKFGKAKFSKQNIGMRNRSFFREKEVFIENVYLGIQHREGALAIDTCKISDFINDGISAWKGDIHIREYLCNHNLDYIYDKSNHSDCFHIFAVDPKTYKRNTFPVENVTIERAVLRIEGSGSSSKGNFMLSELVPYKNFKLFSKGISVTGNNTNIPVINATNLQDSIIGSWQYPVDPELVGSRPIRIMNRKSNQRLSKNIEIHVYKGTVIQLDKHAKKETKIYLYHKKWSRQERQDYYEVRKAGFELL